MTQSVGNHEQSSGLFNKIIYGNPAWIGRVIGMPNDYVEVKPDGVYINSIHLVEPYETSSLKAELASGMKIPAFHYLLLRDNRQIYNSKDEIFERLVPGESIRGRIFFRLWPLSKYGPLFPPGYNLGK
jgi:signal peptidase I